MPFETSATSYTLAVLVGSTFTTAVVLEQHRLTRAPGAPAYHKCAVVKLSLSFALLQCSAVYCQLYHTIVCSLVLIELLLQEALAGPRA